MKTYKVAIVDDHVLFAQALENLVNTFDEFHVIYQAKNGKDFLEKLCANDNKPDMVLLDINMPQLNGIETMGILQQKYPAIKVLALSMDDEENTIIKMLRAGAKGYLLKDIHPKVFYNAMTDVMEKGYYYSEKVTSLVVNALHQGDIPKVALKDREIEFLKLACTEKTYKEIADDMNLSPKTIDGYREALFDKLEVKSRIGLVLFAIKHDLYKV